VCLLMDFPGLTATQPATWWNDSPRCQDSCRVCGVELNIDRGRKETPHHRRFHHPLIERHVMLKHGFRGITFDSGLALNAGARSIKMPLAQARGSADLFAGRRGHSFDWLRWIRPRVLPIIIIRPFSHCVTPCLDVLR
jgi:hypothetical protein